LRPKKIVLYGSYDDESDIDVMVLVNGVDKKECKKFITDIRLELTINYSILPSITIIKKTVCKDGPFFEG